MNFIPSYSGTTKSVTPLYEPDFSSIDWTPIRKELKLERDGEYYDVPNRWEILRSDNQAHLGVVSNRYEPIPYQDNVKTLIKAINEIQINKLVDDSSATISIEPLEKGKKLKVVVNFPNETIQPVVGDLSNLKVLMYDSTDSSWTWQILYIMFRYWCSNGCSNEDFKLRWNQKHTKSISDEQNLQKIYDKIVYSVNNFHENEGRFRQWADTGVTFEAAMEVFSKTLAQYRDKNGKLAVSKNVMLDLEAYTHKNYREVGHTAWGAYNAATEWATHFQNSSFQRNRTVKNPSNTERRRASDVATMLESNHWKEITREISYA
tara:strand:- start:1085 stop:2041 length:957 start_codon:yes stop_codon:yes gene_type:complete